MGQNSAKGGLIQKFAEGGMIEDDDLDDEEGGALPTQAIPTSGQGLPGYTNKPGMLTPTAQSARPAAAAVPATPRTMGGMPIPQPRPASAPPITPEQQAVADGLKYFAGQINQAPAVGSSRKSLINAMAQGAGAAPTNEMLKIFRKIDPTGKKYSEGERNLIALNTVYDYKMKTDPEGAARTAFQMLQHFNTAQTRYGALAAAAMKNGAVDEGVKLALKQYANIPDGNNLDMWVDPKTKRIGWELTTKDENGEDKKVSGGVATPEEIGSAAMGLASPGGFQNHLAQMVSGAKIGGSTAPVAGAGIAGAGGGRGAKVTDPNQSPDAPKAAEYKELKKEDVDDHVDKWAAGLKGKTLDAKELTATKDMLYHIRRNNDVTSDEGLRRIETLIKSPEPTKKGEAPPFRAVENKDAKTYTISFPDQGELTIPSSEIGLYKNARSEFFKQQAKAAEEAAEKAKGGWGVTDIVEGTKGKLAEWDKSMDDRVEGFRKANPEFIARGQSAGRAVGRAAEDAAQWFKDQKDKPAAWEQDVVTPVNKAVGAVGPAVSEAQKYLRDNPEATP